MSGGGAVVRRVLAGALGVASAVTLTLALRAPAGAGARGGGGSLTTPLWSVRRVPQALVDGVGDQRLSAALTTAASGASGCFAVRDDGGSVAEASPSEPGIPASTLKLLTATAVLDRMGPDYRYETRAVAAGPVRDGTVTRLWLVGAGDPGIATPERVAAMAADPITAGGASTPLADLADRLVAAGIRSIPGGVVGDDSRYDRTRYLPQWPPSYRDDGEVGPIGALTVDEGFTGDAGDGPPAGDPALAAADQLARLLRERGVTVGSSSIGRAPADPAIVATLTSPPLREVIGAFLASSENGAGEMLTRELAVQAGRPGTTPEGVAVTTETLARLGLPTEELVMVDGSGLARDNRVTCALLLAVLGLADEPRFDTLRAGLAVAGERGTLATRLRGTSLQGRLRAKTGSLSGVSGMAGFMDVRRPLAFSLLLVGPFGERAGMELRERLAVAIAEYPDAPPPDDLVPPPETPGSATSGTPGRAARACPRSTGAC